MDYRILGRTGVKVSPICLGTANFADPTPEKDAARIIDRALDAGINLIDTGDSYAAGESENIIGRSLEANKRRHQVILATKAGHVRGGPNDNIDPEIAQNPNTVGNSRHNIIRACEASLRRLRTNHIDLYQVHRPDFSIPIDETLGALTDLVRQGKVRYIGCSTHPAWAVMEALMVSEKKDYSRYISEQPPYNLLDRRIENELVPLCLKYGLGIIPWGPMAMGVLSGRYANAHDYPGDSRAAYRGSFYADRVSPKGIEAGNKFVNISKKHGIPPSQLAVLWIKDQPGITAPLIGPRTLQHLEDLLPVAEMKLDESIRNECDKIVPPGSAVADFHNTAAWMKMKVL